MEKSRFGSYGGSMKGRIEWPDSHDFAFTIFDDTDFSVLPDIKEV